MLKSRWMRLRRALPRPSSPGLLAQAVRSLVLENRQRAASSSRRAA
ncbi:MAG: hypothetical protein R3E42_08150 [Burkholderiaceae bacterium]